MNMWQKIYPHVLAGLLLAGVLGVWRMSLQVEVLTTKLINVVERIDKREVTVNKRLERLEDKVWNSDN